MSNNNTAKITEGQTLTARSACDYECIFSITIISRKGNFATFKWMGQEVKKKIKSDERGEFIIAGSYSMAPIFRA